jgi:hypothetical protein
MGAGNQSSTDRKRSPAASYKASLAEAYRQVGICTRRIIKGVKPAELQILLPSRPPTVDVDQRPRSRGHSGKGGRPPAKFLA